MIIETDDGSTLNTRHQDDPTPGWICPKCQHEAINIVATVMTRVTVDGCDGPAAGFSYEWDDDSRALCDRCNWEGTANDAAQAAQEKYSEAEP